MGKTVIVRIALSAALAVSAMAAQAQSLPKPKEFYFDVDATSARRLMAISDGLQGDALAAQLVKMMERGRKPVEATSQLAHIAFQSDRTELGRTLYKQAFDKTGGAGSNLGRAVAWNYGWNLLHAGDAEGALGQWGELVGSSLGGPSWIPPTLALGLWQAGRKDEAVQWYAAAVRTEPEQWSDAANFATLLPDWSLRDRDTLAQVLAAWQAAPPAWP